VASEPETSAAPATATFELRRFAWLTPDRLGVSGRFAGLQKPADRPPVLVIRAGERVLRLPVAADSLGGSPEEGDVWEAAFEWRDAPVAFDAAELELGDVVVDLPELDGKRRTSRRRVLEVRTADGSEDRAAEPPAAPRDAAESGALPVFSQVELVAAQEEVREARVAMEQTEQELARVRDDLRAERERRTGDSERFREALAQLRESAEEAVAGEQSVNRQLAGELREARETAEEHDATVGELRERLEAAESARTVAEDTARAEVDALRERVGELERDSKEIGRLQAELDRTRARADVARTELEKARGAVDQARGDAEKLIARLTAVSPK
jgi:DNA repair exonuclease SbcCD ATPase subunit